MDCANVEKRFLEAGWNAAVVGQKSISLRKIENGQQIAAHIDIQGTISKCWISCYGNGETETENLESDFTNNEEMILCMVKFAEAGK